MSVWGDIRKRAEGKEIRQEDIHKCTAVVQKSGGAVRIRGFYNLYKDHIVLNEEQKHSLRWHEFYIHLKDERFNRWRKYKVSVITHLGDSGESTVKDAIQKVEKKYGYFDGYTCEEVNPEMHKYVTEKNLEMIREIRVDLNRHDMKMVGWRECTVDRKAIDAELIQNLYYNTDDATAKYYDKEVMKQTHEFKLLTSGKYREKVIGYYRVTYLATKKNSNGEILSEKSIKIGFLAVIGTDVIATWQKMYDDFVRENGVWTIIIGPEGNGKVLEDDEYYEQEVLYDKARDEYKEKLFQEYGEKIPCE